MEDDSYVLWIGREGFDTKIVRVDKKKELTKKELWDIAQVLIEKFFSPV